MADGNTASKKTLTKDNKNASNPLRQCNLDGPGLFTQSSYTLVHLQSYKIYAIGIESLNKDSDPSFRTAVHKRTVFQWSNKSNDHATSRASNEPPIIRTTRPRRIGQRAHPEHVVRSPKRDRRMTRMPCIHSRMIDAVHAVAARQ